MRKAFQHRCLVALGFLLTLTPAWGQRPDLISPLQYDINGDGAIETVAVRPFVQDGVELGQLVLLDSSGKVLWAGSSHSGSPSYPTEPDIFLGEYDLGDLEVVGDFAGNGKVMLLGTFQKSDVSPTRFRLFEWDGAGFRHCRSGNLVPAPQRPATFVWADAPGSEVWIESFRDFDANGLFHALLSDIQAGEETEILLAPDGEEFVLRLPTAP
jgi:hypothetical protein